MPELCITPDRKHFEVTVEGSTFGPLDFSPAPTVISDPALKFSYLVALVDQEGLKKDTVYKLMPEATTVEIDEIADAVVEEVEDGDDDDGEEGEDGDDDAEEDDDEDDD